MILWKLNEVMSARGVRNKELALALDITENSVYRLRKSEEMPRLTPDRLEGICLALQCQPGELLEWVQPASQQVQSIPRLVDAASSTISDSPSAVLVERSQVDSYSAMSKAALQRLNEFYPQILALSWRGYRQFGPGAVVVTDADEGLQIAYVEQKTLSDPGCHAAVERTRPELAAVVLYYQSQSYDAEDYEVLRLTGPKTPPEYHRALDNFTQ
ncbi:helix-turn-helix transcriptional regulator [Halomicronema sp. CCY15110]|uniref:helix-turn-helix domain-containing protein n=1 Tax=Halomicronema sp. CCY15110 TaxID=2767773 RepID=UPI0028158982|nr:helix-turn-helix transcriptional regulator [Halomicronema sp. CCY15110]